MMGKNFVNSNVSQLAGASGKETRNRYVKPVSAEVALITDAYFLNVSMEDIDEGDGLAKKRRNENITTMTTPDEGYQ